jgi:D-3-phosphoglycerate dehydrogenase
VARVLVTEKIARSGLDALRAAGHEVDEALGVSPDELLDAIKGAAALIVRSATQVTADVLAAGEDLVVVGRAGVGIDNVDVEAATARGVMVVNAPLSNVLSAAEQAMALLLAQARNLPQAHASLTSGKWERSRFEGVELSGKVLGVVGLGRVGALVAQRASAFGMRLVAYDPFVSAERAAHMGVELLTLEELIATSDFVSIHLPKNASTIGLIDAALLANAKPGQRIINTARGGIIVEADLAEAIRSGTIQGAGLDVFATEPCTESPLFSLDTVVVAPHLGASTKEAQERAGETIAEQVVLALDGAFVPFAVNLAAGEASDVAHPFMPLAEQLGRIFGWLHDGDPDTFEVHYQGELAGAGTEILTLCVLKGVCSVRSELAVSYVNAPQLAAERAITWSESSSLESPEFVSLVTVRSGLHSVSGTLAQVGSRIEPRIVAVDGHAVDVPPAPNMLVVRNDDRPGMIGLVGTELGRAGVSISSMAVGPGPDGTALMVLSCDRRPGDEVVATLRDGPGIHDSTASSSDSRPTQGRRGTSGHVSALDGVPVLTVVMAPWRNLETLEATAETTPSIVSTLTTRSSLRSTTKP